MDEFDPVHQELADSENRLETAVRAAGRHRHNRDRSFIVYAVVCLYVGVIGLSILFLLYRGLWCGESVFENVLEVVKISILPVLTLVIGYYFGTKSE
jgi:hypothetical protein